MNKDNGKLQELFQYWFIQYNPFYFFSALCILAGVFLVSHELEKIQLIKGKIILATVVQIYEFCLIFSCALLFRKLRQKRPAVILGLLEVLFLFDCTCETTVLLTLGKTGLLLSIIWMALIVLKIELLAWAFCLKLDTLFYLIPIFAGIGLVIFPNVLSLGILEKSSLHLLATWGFAALIGLLIRYQPKVICNVELDDWGNLVFYRAIKATWAIWLSICCLHILSWLMVYNINLSLAHFSPFILLALVFTDQEEWIWSSSLAIVLFNPSSTAMFVPTLLMVALGLLWQGKKLVCYRFWVGAILAIYYAFYIENLHYWHIPKFTLALTLVVAVSLLLIAWQLKLLSAALIGAVLFLLPMATYSKTLTVMEIGVLLLSLGFLSLLAGIGFNWKQSLIKRE
jgi:hypothetical protein